MTIREKPQQFEARRTRACDGLDIVRFAFIATGRMLCVLGVAAACTQRAETRGAPAPKRSAPARATASTAPTLAKPAASSATARAFYADRFSKRPYPPDVTELGRALFFDPALSASGKMACATCHDPRFAYGPPNERATQLGGPKLVDVGQRAVPSLRYLDKVPRFSEHFFDEDGDESADQGPTGGRTWDGRADTLHDQALLPLTSPFEMANASVDAVVAKVRAASYASRFEATFGADVFADAERGAAAVLLALEIFQQSPKDFYPFTSRYDAYLRRQTTLTEAEERGLAAFNDPARGNCAHCHPSRVRHGKFPTFTDFGFAALGAPRNRTLPQNGDPKFFDLGLCGPLRTDLAKHREYCGEFRVPSLRNVTSRKTFFHNGAFHDLGDVLRFYATRDTTPDRWYRGGVRYDDLPAENRGNVNQEPPFGRKAGRAPALSSQEIADIRVFLATLTDEDVVEARRVR